MKTKFIMPVMALSLALAVTACSSEDDVNEWGEDGWSGERYPTITYAGKEYIKVPAEGGRYVFHSQKSDFIWLSNHSFTAQGNTYFGDSQYDINHYLRYFWCDLKAQGDSLVVVIEPNDKLARKIGVGVTDGSTNETFNFFQESPYYDKKGSNGDRFVGDWVYDASAGIGGSYKNSMTRYTFREDGSYISTYEHFGDSSTECWLLCYKGEWLNFCDYMYTMSTTQSDVERWNCEVADDKLYIQFHDGGPKIPFVKGCNSDETLMPVLNFGAKPSKSVCLSRLMPGEPYILECSLMAKGYNYELTDAVLVRRSYTDFADTVCDTIDISQYKSNNYCFSIPMTAPGRNYSVNYDFEYKGRFTKVNSVDKSKGIDKCREFSRKLTVSLSTER